jgi:hypothetical protein
VWRFDGDALGERRIEDCEYARAVDTFDLVGVGLHQPRRTPAISFNFFFKSLVCTVYTRLLG